MFWRKCGKMIARGNSLINCDFSPCGGYGVFAFVETGISSPEAEVNPCAGQSATVLPCIIKNGHICYADPYGWGSSIDIALHAPDFQRKVGYFKGCTSSYEQCVEWDEQTWDCIREQTIYEGCKQLKVYMLTQCYEQYNDFREAFFDPCYSDSSSSSEFEYPEVWEGGNLTWEAEQCLSNYWNRFGNALRVKNNVVKQAYGMSYNASAWDMVCTNEVHVVDTDPETGEVIWEWDECLDYQTLLLNMYNTSWGQDYSVALPPDASEEQIAALWASAMATCNGIIEDAWENYENWTYTSSTTDSKCIDDTITGGGSCYGGEGCHSFLWDGAGYNLYKFLEPSDVSTLQFCAVGKPVGARIKFNNVELDVRWNNYAKTAAQTAGDNLITEPYYLATGECYEELNTQCPGSTNTVRYQIQLLRYIWS